MKFVGTVWKIIFHWHTSGTNIGLGLSHIRSQTQKLIKLKVTGENQQEINIWLYGGLKACNR